VPTLGGDFTLEIVIPIDRVIANVPISMQNGNFRRPRQVCSADFSAKTLILLMRGVDSARVGLAFHRADFRSAAHIRRKVERRHRSLLDAVRRDGEIDKRDPTRPKNTVLGQSPL
jgi:hypothetical protein